MWCGVVYACISVSVYLSVRICIERSKMDVRCLPLALFTLCVDLGSLTKAEAYRFGEQG